MFGHVQRRDSGYTGQMIKDKASRQEEKRNTIKKVHQCSEGEHEEVLVWLGIGLDGGR